MKQFIVFLFVGSLSLSLTAQEINQTDGQGNKQGTWKKYYPSNDGLFYEGQFKDDKPYGIFTHYYESGEVKSKTSYDGAKVHSEVFYLKGQLMASGMFVDQKKDSIWNYYDEAGWLSLHENYVKGKRSGESFSYYPDGEIAVMKTFLDDKENGPFIQNFRNGKTEMEGEYLGGNYNGKYIYYYDTGKKLHTGDYINGKRNGVWVFYNANGSIKSITQYKIGIIVKEEPKNGEFAEYYDTGLPKSIFHYKGGELDGAFVEYYNVGEKVLLPREKKNSYEPDEFEEVLQGQIIKHQGTYNKGILVGEESFYDESGELLKKEMHTK